MGVPTKMPARALLRALRRLCNRDPAAWAAVLDIVFSACFVVTDFWSPSSNKASNHVQIALAVIVLARAHFYSKQHAKLTPRFGFTSRDRRRGNSDGSARRRPWRPRQRARR